MNYSENNIGDIGAKSLSDALKTNTTLIGLNLSCEHKRKEKKKKKTQIGTINNSLSSVFIQSSDNELGDTGATSLIDALKSNTTLTELYLDGEDKRNNTQMASINNSLFSIFIK